MTADVELLPLYAELQGHPKLEIIKHYARANMEPLIAEIEALRVRADAMAGEAIKHEARAERLAEALRMIAMPQRSDGTWNRDRETCRQIAEEALRDHDQEGKDG